MFTGSLNQRFLCGSPDKKSILFLGRPGIGKTTVIRDVARFMSTELDQRVMIVDRSNEIAGDGDVPHACIGQSGRLQVPHSSSQYAVMVCTKLYPLSVVTNMLSSFIVH